MVARELQFRWREARSPQKPGLSIMNLPADIAFRLTDIGRMPSQGQRRGVTRCEGPRNEIAADAPSRKTEAIMALEDPTPAASVVKGKMIELLCGSGHRSTHLLVRVLRLNDAWCGKCGADLSYDPLKDTAGCAVSEAPSHMNLVIVEATPEAKGTHNGKG